MNVFTCACIGISAVIVLSFVIGGLMTLFHRGSHSSKQVKGMHKFVNWVSSILKYVTFMLLWLGLVWSIYFLVLGIVVPEQVVYANNLSELIVRVLTVISILFAFVEFVCRLSDKSPIVKMDSKTEEKSKAEEYKILYFYEKDKDVRSKDRKDRSKLFFGSQCKEFLISYGFILLSSSKNFFSFMNGALWVLLWYTGAILLSRYIYLSQSEYNAAVKKATHFAKKHPQNTVEKGKKYPAELGGWNLIATLVAVGLLMMAILSFFTVKYQITDFANYMAKYKNLYVGIFVDTYVVSFFTIYYKCIVYEWKLGSSQRDKINRVIYMYKESKIKSILIHIPSLIIVVCALLYYFEHEFSGLFDPYVSKIIGLIYILYMLEIQNIFRTVKNWHLKKKGKAIKKKIIFVMLEQYADWEVAYLSSAFDILGNGRYEVKTTSLTRKPVTSIGGFRVIPDYKLRNIPSDYEALILIGGKTWSTINTEKIEPLIAKCITEEKVLAGIGDAIVFLGKAGALNNARHTSNDLNDLKLQAGEAYTGEKQYVMQQAVSDKKIITANGTAALEFAKEVLLALAVPKDKVLAWYKFHKHGCYEAVLPKGVINYMK